MTSEDDCRPRLKRRAADDLPGPSIKRPRSQSPSTRTPPPSGHGRGRRGKAPASVLRRSSDSPPLPGPSHGPHGSEGANAHYIDPHVMPGDYHKPLYPSMYASANYGALAPFYPPPPFAGPGSGTLDPMVASFEAALMGGCYPPVLAGYPPLAFPGPLPGFLAPPPGAPAPFPVFYPPYPAYGPPVVAPQPHALASQPYVPGPQPHAPAPHPPQPAPAQDQDYAAQYYDALRAAFAATPTPTERLHAEAWRDAYPGEYPEIPPVYPIRVSSPPARLPELIPDAVRVVGEGGVSREGGVTRDELSAPRDGLSTPRDELSTPQDESCARSETSSPDPFTPLTPAEVTQHTLRARERAAPWYECISRWRETVREGEGEDAGARYLPRACVDYARKTPARYSKDPRAGYPKDPRARDLKATRARYSKDPRARDLRVTRLPTPQPPYMGPFNPPYDVDEGACRLPAARVPFSKDPTLRDWRRPVGAGEGVGAGASEPISVDPPEEEFGEGEFRERSGEEQLRERAGEGEPHEEAGVTQTVDGLVDAFAGQLDELIGGNAARLVDARAGEMVEARVDAPAEEPLVPRSYAQQLEREVAQLEKNVAELEANVAELEQDAAKEVERLEANVAELETDAAQFRTVLAAAEHDVADLGEELLFARRLAAGARAALAGCRYQLERMKMQLEDAEGERGAAV